MSRNFVPDAGDIVWLDFSPQTGRQQAGRQSAIVLSAALYNSATSLMLCCPVTTRIKSYPFEVALNGEPASVALADHAKSVDWRARKAVLKGRVQPAELAGIRAKLRALIG